MKKKNENWASKKLVEKAEAAKSVGKINFKKDKSLNVSINKIANRQFLMKHTNETYILLY